MAIKTLMQNFFSATVSESENEINKLSTKKVLARLTVEEIDLELFARGVQLSGGKCFEFVDEEEPPARQDIMCRLKELYNTPITHTPFNALSHISTTILVKALIKKSEQKSRLLKEARGTWGKDQRLDFKQITDERIKQNACSVAAICMDRDLSDINKNFAALRVKNFGKSFNLCRRERFRHQPIAAGYLCTGFLVRKDVIATAGHCADENNVKNLRFAFDYKISGSRKTVARMSKRNIYRGEKILKRVYDPMGSGSDLALVKLDRNVDSQPVVTLSVKPIAHKQPVYVIGHPCGLPLKFAPGAQIQSIHDSYFSADLDIYAGNSGSPVFDALTHEVVGLVARGDNSDFRWTGNGWLSVVYPNSDICSKGAQCTTVSSGLLLYCLRKF